MAREQRRHLTNKLSFILLIIFLNLFQPSLADYLSFWRNEISLSQVSSLKTSPIKTATPTLSSAPTSTPEPTFYEQILSKPTLTPATPIPLKGSPELTENEQFSQYKKPEQVAEIENNVRQTESQKYSEFINPNNTQAILAQAKIRGVKFTQNELDQAVNQTRLEYQDYASPTEVKILEAKLNETMAERNNRPNITLTEYKELLKNQKPLDLPRDWKSKLKSVSDLKEKNKNLTNFLNEKEEQNRELKTNLTTTENLFNNYQKEYKFKEVDIEKAVNQKEQEWISKKLINPHNETELELAELVKKPEESTTDLTQQVKAPEENQLQKLTTENRDLEKAVEKLKKDYSELGEENEFHKERMNEFGDQREELREKLNQRAEITPSEWLQAQELLEQQKEDLNDLSKKLKEVKEKLNEQSTTHRIIKREKDKQIKELEQKLTEIKEKNQKSREGLELFYKWKYQNWIDPQNTETLLTTLQKQGVKFKLEEDIEKWAKEKEAEWKKEYQKLNTTKHNLAVDKKRLRYPWLAI